SSVLISSFLPALVVLSAGLCRIFSFSSRRRHTSSKRDWSSDVCSSDLYRWNTNAVLRILERREYTGCTVNFKTYTKSLKFKKRRSEERRGGKEWRSGVRTEQRKQRGERRGGLRCVGERSVAGRRASAEG